MPHHTHHTRELPTALLDQVTGGGLRSWSFGAMTALSVAMGSPAGSKMDHPAPIVPLTQTVGTR